MAKCGRKKGSKNKQSGEPHNFGYWVQTLRNKKTVNAFIERGDKRAKNEIIYVLKYCKKYEPEIYEELNGQDILRRLKK